MTFGKSSPLSEPQFSHLYNKDNNSDSQSNQRAEAKIDTLGGVRRGMLGANYHTPMQREVGGLKAALAALVLPR